MPVKHFLLKTLLKVGFYPMIFILIMWAFFLVDSYTHLHLTELGTSPRTTKGLLGIFFSPFLHSNLEHIASNTLPMLVLGMITFYFYKPIAWSAFFWIFFMSGIWLWVGGRNNDEGEIYHIGASGLIYGMAVFLFFSGVFRKHKPLMVISALVAFLYGSMMYGIFPLMPHVSWEAHLFGAISGLMVAYNYRKEGPQRKEFEWKESEYDKILEEEALNSVQENPTITYHFIPKPPDESSLDKNI